MECNPKDNRGRNKRGSIYDSCSVNLLSLPLFRVNVSKCQHFSRRFAKLSRGHTNSCRVIVKSIQQIAMLQEEASPLARISVRSNCIGARFFSFFFLFTLLSPLSTREEAFCRAFAQLAQHSNLSMCFSVRKERDYGYLKRPLSSTSQLPPPPLLFSLREPNKSRVFPFSQLAFLSSLLAHAGFNNVRYIIPAAARNFTCTFPLPLPLRGSSSIPFFSRV